MRDFTVIDLFCGCGGMSWGLHQAGFNILAGVDNDPKVLQTFALNHPGSLALEAEMTQLTPQDLMSKLSLQPGDLDCLIGGPPCQGFSKNVPAVSRFLDDPRNQLFRNFLHFVAVLQPKVVIMENVAEIYTAYSGAVCDEVVAILSKLNYTVEVKVLFAPDYGVPQKRRRCIFFASRTSVPPEFPSPGFRAEPTLFEQQYRTAWDAIADLPPLNNGDGYEPMAYDAEPQNEYQQDMRSSSSVLYDHITRKLNEKQMARISLLRPGQGMRDLPKELQAKSGYSGAYGRLDFQMLAPTITRWFFHPGSGRFCHPRDVRLLTIREAARLQSFSDDFRFTGTYIQKSHQVGNAVPPLLMRAIAPKIKACLELPESRQWSMPVANAAD